MNSQEVVETSDDEERELKWLPTQIPSNVEPESEKADRHDDDGQSLRKRMKLYHDYDPMELPYGTPPRSSSVPWPSSVNTSPNLLASPTRFSSPSTVATRINYLIDTSLRPSPPRSDASEEKPNDTLPAAMSSSPLVSHSEDEEPPDIQQELSTHTSTLSSPHALLRDVLPAVPSDLYLVSKSEDEETPDMQQEPLTHTSPIASPHAQLRDILPAILPNLPLILTSEDEESPDIQEEPSHMPLPHVRLRSPSADPMSLFDASPTRLFDPPASAKQATPIRDARRLEDIFSPASVAHHTGSHPTLLATPARSPLHASPQPMSPLTPLHERILSSPQNSPLQDPPPPADNPQPAINPAAPHDPLFDEANLDIPNISRYPLRRRAPAQLKPYTVEKFQYKQALSANPDAIVNIRGTGRVNNDHYDHTDDHPEESQPPWQPPEETQDDSDGERVRIRERTRVREAPRPGAPTFTGLLQDLPSSDDEESKSMRTFSKEARRVEKERRRKARSEEQRLAQLAQEESDRAKARRRRAFPIRPDRSGSEQREASRPRSVSNSLVDYPPSPSSPDTMHTRRPTSPLPSEPTSPSQRSSRLSLRATRSTSPPYFSDHDQMDVIDVQPSPRSSPNNSDAEMDIKDSSDVELEEEVPDAAETKAERKATKELRRLYPHSMVNQLGAGPSIASKSKPKSKRRSAELSGSENEENAVLPGQSRTAWSKNTWSNREIKGDTESSDDQRSSVNDSMSDNDWVGQPSGLRGHAGIRYNIDVVDLTGDVSDESDEDDGVDDWEIQAYLAGDTVPKKERASSSGHMREESLIDWMLARTRTVGGPRRPKTKRRPPDGSRNSNRAASSSKYNIDVTTHGSRQERQTRLNFDGHTRTKPTSRRSGGRHAAPSSRISRHKPAGAEAEADDDRDRVMAVPDPNAPPPKKDRKQKERERRARAKGNGLHVFASDNTHFVHGRSRRTMFTRDLEEDDGFLQAIAPLSQDWARPLQPARIVNTDFKEPAPKRLPPSRSRPAAEDGVRTVVWERMKKDCGISVLPSGKSFNDDSYIRKGWLHELVSIIRLETPPPPPIRVTYDGMELGPEMSVDGFTKTLKQVFDKLFDVVAVTSQLGIENECEWLRVQRATTQLLSWLLASATDADKALLEATVQDQVSRFVSCMPPKSLERESLNTFSLSICWFAVELSARLDLPYRNPSSSIALGRSIPFLMNCLREYGMDSVIDLIQSDLFPSGLPLTHYAAELWVSVFHLLDSRKDADELTKKQLHPFTSYLQEIFEADARLPQRNQLALSELIWQSIFCQCALTQFSVHGMTTSASRLPASWGFVVHALNQVRLTHDPSSDHSRSQESLDNKDFYAQIITERCFLLWKHWHWCLDDVSTVFDRLSKIFQSRNFAGLRHEKPDYPSFLSNHDWTVLDKHEPKDSAFVVFLKLLFHAVGCDETDPKRFLTPKAKKMLSMAVSVTKLPFSKKTPTDVQDLSMLYNRLSAVAIGIRLDPMSHVQRMKTARTYVDFSDADDTTRVGVIRGMIHLATILKDAKSSVECISSWVEEMAIVMANDYRALGESLLKSAEHGMVLGRMHFGVQLLVGAVRQILEAYQVDSNYPEPVLLRKSSLTFVDVVSQPVICTEALDPIFKAQILADEPRTAEQIRQMLSTFLDARKRALAPPDRSSITQVERESQESQDEYPDMAIDFDDPELLAALDQGGFELPASETTELGIKEQTLSSPWLRYLNMRLNWTHLPLSDNTRRRLDFKVMEWILKFDPKAYADYKDVYIENLLTALVSTDPKDEHDFIRLVLEVDKCQHPLLVGVSTEVHDDAPEDASSDTLRGMTSTIARNVSSLIILQQL
ncbi:hypothetical protein DXG01_005121 [Tephrocybe rancida]|nr:hypothetical protein DXG01_005121 [Tephrocybe rancida]